MKKGIISILLVLSFMLVGCEEKQQPANDTSSYVYDFKETIDLESKLMLNVYEIEEGIIVKTYEETNGLLSLTRYDNDYQFVADIVTYDTSNYVIYDVDCTDDYVIVTVRELTSISAYIEVITISDLSKRTITIAEGTYFEEEATEVFEDYLLVKTTNTEQRIVTLYNLSMSNWNEREIITYNSTIQIMDTTIEDVYDSTNSIVDGYIVIARADYTIGTDGFTVFKVDDDDYQRTETITSISCDMVNTSTQGTKVITFENCDNTNYITVYDITNEDFKVQYEVNMDLQDYRVKDANDEYFVVSNGNYSRTDATVYVFNVNDNELYSSIYAPDGNQWFGNHVLLGNEYIAISTLKDDLKYIYVLDLATHEVIELDTVVNNHTITQYRLISIENDSLVFEVETDSEYTYLLNRNLVLENGYLLGAHISEYYPYNYFYYQRDYILTEHNLYYFYNYEDHKIDVFTLFEIE